MKQTPKIAIFLLFIGLLFLPVVQRNTGLFPEKGLAGLPDPAVYPRFTLRDWFSGGFQEQFNQAAEENLGFRPGLVRLKNQVDYSLFRKANASGVVVGRHFNLFESDYIRSFTGRDYLGDDFWTKKFDRLDRVADTLAKTGTRLAIVLEPGKGTFSREDIPARFKADGMGTNNYSAILREAHRTGIPLLDLNQWFRESKASAPWPLFPKGGIHWSVGGMVLACDTLLSFINDDLRIPVPDLIIDGAERSGSLRDTDNDVVRVLNLACKPRHPVMAYPTYRFESPDSLRKPRVLAISDSFYFNLMGGSRITSQAFANEAFWYYNKEIYPDSWSAPKDTASVNIREEVESMDLVIIMVTERFYHRFDWDFTDVLFKLYFPDEIKDYRYDYRRDIIRNYVWFDNVQREADYAGIPMRERLVSHSDYLFWEADQAGRLPHDIAYYQVGIEKDSAWMKQIREKAALNGITVEEQVRLDAEWVMKQNAQ